MAFGGQLWENVLVFLKWLSEVNYGQTFLSFLGTNIQNFIDPSLRKLNSNS